MADSRACHTKRNGPSYAVINPHEERNDSATEEQAHRNHKDGFVKHPGEKGCAFVQDPGKKLGENTKHVCNGAGRGACA